MGLGKAEIERCDWTARRGKAPEPSWYWARGGKERVRNGGRWNQRNLWGAFRAGVERYRVWEGNAHQGREEGSQGGAGWPMVDIKGWPCWIFGSGDGYVPISLSNCQKSNLVSGAWTGLGLNRRQA